MKYLTFVLLAVVLPAWATTDHPTPPPHDPVPHEAPFLEVMTDQAQQQQQTQQQALDPTFNVNPTQKQDQSLNAPQKNKQVVNVVERHPDDIRFKNNPSLNLGAIPRNPECWINNSIAGGSGWGSGGGIFTREDPWCRSEREFVRLAEMGLNEQAAVVYCQPFRTGILWRKDNGRWRPFGDVATCETKVQNVLDGRQGATLVTVNIEVDAGKQTCVSEQRNTVVRQVQDDGLLYVYDCVEKEVRGKMQYD